MQWHRRLGVMVGSPSLEVFKTCADVALGVVVSGHGGLGLEDLRISVGFPNLSDSMK